MSNIILNTKYIIIGQPWSTGYEIEIDITNSSSNQVLSWTCSFNLPVNEYVSSFWNCTMISSIQNSDNTTTITINNPSWSGIINSGDTVSLGMIISSKNIPYPSTNITNLNAEGNVNSILPPVAPVLNSINITGNSYTVSWNKVNSATSYILQQSMTNDFSQNIKFSIAGSTTSKSFSSVSNGTYYYRVQALNTAGTSAFSNVQSVVVSVTLPNPPVLQEISNTNGNYNYIIQWSTINNAQSYILEESSSSSFTNSSIIYSGNANTFQVNNKPVGTYYYRVRSAINGVQSINSNIVSTTVTQNIPISNIILEGYWESWNDQDSITSIVNMKANIIDISFGTFTALGNNTFVISGVEADNSTITSLVSATHTLGKKVKIAIGGATYPLSTFLTSVDAAKGMATAISDYVTKFKLDGVDFDIEDHPSASLQIALIQATRNILPTPIIITYTSATPASTSLPFKDVIIGSYTFCDWINIMAYDHGPNYSYQQDISNLISMGVPASKIVLGLMPGNDDEGYFTSLSDIKNACQYILNTSLKGIMFWDLNLDLENQTTLGSSAAINTAAQIFAL